MFNYQYSLCFNTIRCVSTSGLLGLNSGKIGLSLDNPNDPNLKSVVIKGIAKYKPGGSAMILSLLIQGAPGMMPGGTNVPQVSPGVQQPSVTAPATSPTSPGQSTGPTSVPPSGPTGPNGANVQVGSSSRPTEGPPPIETSGGPSTIPGGGAPTIPNQVSSTGPVTTPSTGPTQKPWGPANGNAQNKGMYNNSSIIYSLPQQHSLAFDIKILIIGQVRKAMQRRQADLNACAFTLLN